MNWDKNKAKVFAERRTKHLNTKLQEQADRIAELETQLSENDAEKALRTPPTKAPTMSAKEIEDEAYYSMFPDERPTEN